MNTHFLSGLIGAAIGFGLGYVLFPSASVAPVVSEGHSVMTTATGHPMHPMVEIDAGKPIPSVSVEAIKDTKDGYNIHVTTKNFRFTPEKANTAPVAGEGHAHIFINEVKLGRLYGDWLHIPGDKLASGTNEILVTLNANDHSEWTENGQHIGDTVSVTK